MLADTCDELHQDTYGLPQEDSRMRQRSGMSPEGIRGAEWTRIRTITASEKRLGGKFSFVAHGRSVAE
jgi:hypothetical protein